MTASQATTFRLNGVDYVAADLSAEGQRLVALLNQAQQEIARLQGQLALIQAGQQQVLEQLKPLLPAPAPSNGGPAVLGQASAQIPTTPVEQPAEEPAPFPDNIPDAIRAR